MAIARTVDRRLFFVLDRTFLQLAQAADRTLAEGSGIGRAQAAVVVYLSYHDGCSLTELSEGIGRRNAAVTGLVDRMEAASLSSDLSLHPNPSLQMTTTASAQTHSALYLPEGGARDANTFEIDKALDAACRKSGQSQSVCLCVTHVMKFEMSLKSYQAATRLYGHRRSRYRLRFCLSVVLARL